MPAFLLIKRQPTFFCGNQAYIVYESSFNYDETILN
jgi:hypothetical protein